MPKKKPILYLPNERYGFQAETSGLYETRLAKYGFQMETVERETNWGVRYDRKLIPGTHRFMGYKDWQKTRVYRAEWKLKEDGDEDFPSQQVTEMVKFAEHVWVELGLDGKLQFPRIIWGTATRVSTYRRIDNTIRMAPAKWARNKITLLHEIAHALCPGNESHGPMFARTLVDLCVKFMGPEVGSTLLGNYMTGQQLSSFRYEYIPVPSHPNPFEVTEEADLNQLPVSYETKVKEIKRKYVAEVAGPKFGLARFGWQTGFMSGTPHNNIVSPYVARQIGMEVPA